MYKIVVQNICVGNEDDPPLADLKCHPARDLSTHLQSQGILKAILSQPYRDNEEVGESTPLQPVLRGESKPFWLK